MTCNPQAANVGAIIVSAQTMDSTLLAIFKKTCAMTVYSPTWSSIGPPTTASIVDRKNETMSSPVFQCILNDNNDVKTDSPFGDDYVVSLGFLIVLVLCVPLGYFNLEDNIWVQQFGFFFLVLCLIAWVVQFFYSGMDLDRLGVLVPPPGVTTGFGSVLSVIIFQFNFALYVPSWLIEKRPDVSVAKSVGWAVVLSSAMFLLLGIMGALAFDYPDGQDFLAVLSSKKKKEMLPTSLVGAYLFPAAALLTGIPVASIVIRYNLVESKLCGTFAANINGVVLPWLLALCFFAGSFLNTLIQWTSALVFVALNLVMPVYMYIITHKRDAVSVAPTSPSKGGAAYSFQNFGNTMLSPDLGESLLGDTGKSINSEQPCVEGVVSVVPDFILKRFKLPRFFLAAFRNPFAAVDFCVLFFSLLCTPPQAHLRAQAFHDGVLVLTCEFLLSALPFSPCCFMLTVFDSPFYFCCSFSGLRALHSKYTPPPQGAHDSPRETAFGDTRSNLFWHNHE